MREPKKQPNACSVFRYLASPALGWLQDIGRCALAGPRAWNMLSAKHDTWQTQGHVQRRSQEIGQCHDEQQAVRDGNSFLELLLR